MAWVSSTQEVLYETRKIKITQILDPISIQANIVVCGESPWSMLERMECSFLSV